MTRILTVFFSMTGETYTSNGIITLNKGFTQQAAKDIQKAVGGDLFQIQQVRTYSSAHYTMIQEAKEEFQNNERPALKEYCNNFDDYDTIFLGFPDWWATMPMPVWTFLEHYDWTGKRIIPFVTSGGSGFANALRDLKKLTPGAEIDENGLEIKGTDVPASTDLIQKWARERI